MSQPFRIDRPTVPPVPVVYDSPHSGRTYPRDFRHAVDLAVLRQAEDTHVEALFGHVPRMGSPLLYCLLPRTYIDVNRALDDFDVGLVDGEWPLPVAPGEKSALGCGLVWAHAGIEGPIYARPLKPEEVLLRIYNVWKPYHESLAGLIDATHAAFGVSYHINCHSMPSHGATPYEQGPALETDFVLGDRDGSTCEPELAEHVRSLIAGQGYRVTVNEPYKGVEIVRRHGRPAEGRHSLQIEINRGLYMDETTRQRSAGFAKLKSDIEMITAGIAEYAINKAGST